MSFADDIKKFSEKAQLTQEEIVVSTLFEINKGVISATPVDTGRARGGWVASIGSPSTGGSTDTTGAKTISSANNKAKKAPGNVYYLTNGVEYIEYLEYGRSQQAPQGMARVTVKDVMSKLRLSNVGS